MGPASIADAILKGTKVIPNKELAYHVLEVLEAMEISSKKDQPIYIQSTL